ncbi:unnamed protein product [Adineta ricciae]|uniref:Ionotropic glutamate receptor C-terminal domain-containing protein n=1 Tax=Adineta ricciae TaxID=249248 RepID=A0A814ZVW7_ADIRI|nr:unnamed protein product [Adineta ricciae]
MFRSFIHLFFYFLLSIKLLNAVRIVGLFPRYDKPSVQTSRYYPSDDWTFHARALFRAAITLANQYEITINKQPINGTLIETSGEGNGFTELDLLCRETKKTEQADIVGIVGPSTSTKSRFLGTFAAHIGIPMMSYAATNAELGDPILYPTFYRIVPSDLLLAEAIVKLFKNFNWTTCTLIFTKDDYGYGGLKILLEKYHLDISIKERLIFDPRFDKFHANMNETLRKSQSQIVLVWANEDHSRKIVQRAINEDLLDSSFVWLMTNKVHTHLLNSQDVPKLQGFLAVLPIIDSSSTGHINEDLQKEAFDIWLNSSEGKGYFPHDNSLIDPYAIYAFDAVWSLNIALNKSAHDGQIPSMNISTHCFDNKLINKDKYEMYLKNTKFWGISGMVEFQKKESNDRISNASYELVNLQFAKYVHIAIWRSNDTKWVNFTGSRIIWPINSSSSVPVDYPQLKNEFVRIMVIEAPPFVIVCDRNSSLNGNLCLRPLATINPNLSISGYVADFIRRLQEISGFNYSIEIAEPFQDYNTVVSLLTRSNRNYDMILSNVRITSQRLLDVAYSVPFHEEPFQVITRYNSEIPITLFSCFYPFTWSVWMTILALIVYSGVLIYFFEYPNQNIENDGSCVKSVFLGVCRALCSVFSVNTDIRLTTNPSRLTVLGLYALGIILIATYTANLSSVLTLNRGRPISGIDDIKNGRVPFDRVGIVSNSAVPEYYIQNVLSDYRPLSSPDEIYSRLLDGTIDAAIWDASVLKFKIDREYCNQLSVVGSEFFRSSIGIAIPENWPFKKDLDFRISKMREEGKLDQLSNDWLESTQCSSSDTAGKPNNQSKQLSLDIVSGLFLSFLILTAIAFILHLWYSRSTIMDICWQIVKRCKVFIEPITKKTYRVQ